MPNNNTPQEYTVCPTCHGSGIAPTEDKNEELLEILRGATSGAFCKYEPACGKDIDIQNLAQAIQALIAKERIAEQAFLDRINLEVNANICECGEPWVDSDIADLIRDRITELGGKE